MQNYRDSVKGGRSVGIRRFLAAIMDHWTMPMLTGCAVPVPAIVIMPFVFVMIYLRPSLRDLLLCPGLTQAFLSDIS